VKSLADGGIGIGVPFAYLPGSKPEEVFRVFQLGAALQALVYTCKGRRNFSCSTGYCRCGTHGCSIAYCAYLNSSTLSQIYFGVAGY